MITPRPNKEENTRKEVKKAIECLNESRKFIRESMLRIDSKFALLEKPPEKEEHHIPSRRV